MRDAWRGARLLRGFAGQRPIHCIVQVSNRCNLTCSFCSFWRNPTERDEELTVDDFEVISTKLSGVGSMVVCIEGGEPLLRPDIAGIVGAFARYHHPVVFTNGWPVTESLARELWRAGATEINVSLDYADPARHDAHRGKAGTFDAALRALDVLAGLAPRGPRQACVMSVLMADNEDQLEPLLELSAARGVRHQFTLLSRGSGRAEGQQRPALGVGARLITLKSRYRHLVTATGYFRRLDRFLAGDVRRPCWAGARFLNINHRGGLSPCVEKLHLEVGDLRRDSWATLAARLKDRPELASCTDCYTLCRGFVEEMGGSPRAEAWREFLVSRW